jgi:hypothetical protein
MASEITHIVFADRLFKEKDNVFNKRDFFIGTVFSDIRYLRVIEREKTHFQNLKTTDVLNEKSSFTAGLKFHSLLDEVREKFIVSHNIYSLIPDFKYITQSVKLLEDETYYQHITDWTNITDFFSIVLPGELVFDVSEQDIKKWHRILQKYFSQKPTDESRREITLALGFPEQICNEINEYIREIRLNFQVEQIIKNFYNQFDTFL